MEITMTPGRMTVTLPTDKFPGMTFSIKNRSCRVCGCTDDDCSQCIAKTGEPCYWVGPDLCSACQHETTPPKANRNIHENIMKINVEGIPIVIAPWLPYVPQYKACDTLTKGNIVVSGEAIDAIKLTDIIYMSEETYYELIIWLHEKRIQGDDL